MTSIRIVILVSIIVIASAINVHWIDYTPARFYAAAAIGFCGVLDIIEFSKKYPKQ